MSPWRILGLALVWLWLWSPLADAGSRNASATSDPSGTGRPSHDDPQQTDLSVRFHLHGYYRLRWTTLHDLDLGYGTTPSTGAPLFPTPPNGGGSTSTADMRLRVDMRLEIARSVRVVMRIDALDNLVLGSTPMGLPRNGQVPSIVATPGQAAPVAGQNALLDSIHLRWAYGEVLLPFGYLAAGRMGALAPWGLGLAVQSGNDLDADAVDSGDRIVLALVLLGHTLLAAYDWSASGPLVAVPGGVNLDIEPRDDVRSYALGIARYDTPEAKARRLRAGLGILNYGLLFSYRQQELDIPNYYGQAPDPQQPRPARSEYLPREAWSLLLSFWFLWRMPWFRIELEAVYARAEIGNSSLVPGVTLTKPITSEQFGGALQLALAPPRGRWGLGLELGLASGDDAPGFGVNAAADQIRTQPGDLDGPQANYPQDTSVNNFRFHPNYRIDQIFWRRIVGQVSDAFYAKAAGHFDITRRLRLWSSVLYSRALFDSTPPGGDANLGVEWDLGARYQYDPGFEIRFTFGAFFPMAGFQSPVSGDPVPAFATHLVLGYIF